MAKSPEEIAAALERLRAGRKTDLPVPVLAEPTETDRPQDGSEARERTTKRYSLGPSSALTKDPRGRQNILSGHDGKGEPPAQQSRPVRAAPRSPDIHAAPPHSLEAELGILSSMMQDPRSTIAEVVAQVTPEWFYVPAHITIYNELVAHWNKGQAIDFITFTQHMRDVGHLDEVGGPAFITHLGTFVPSPVNISYYIEIVRDKYLLRQVISSATKAAQRAYTEQDEVSTLIDEIEQDFINIGNGQQKGQVREMKDNVMRAFEIMEQAAERKGGITGLATGFHDFDRMTGGLQRSEMIVIAARPSMGKTALVINAADHVAVNLKLPVAVFSLEMSVEQLTQRLLCSRAGVNLQKLRDGCLAEQDYTLLTCAGSKFAESILLIDDAAGLNILELKARARRLKAQYDIQLLVLDYLQLLHSSSKRSQENRQIEITEVSGGLKSLAKELKIPVLVAAQLNRQPEARYRGKPRLSDLRESGSIEQDADVVGLLCRPEVYEDDQEARHEMAGEAELTIAKQRNGPIGAVHLMFLKEFTRFETRVRNISPEDEHL